ncbi:hypothetical protein FIM69_00050 [Helicobacter pylori]|uniref:hypothetical protein n=1 Tax=Helicobacter pylori TaxID=210 RepID=UPI001129FD3C|nr:hypothetical protein [Helicobacter pylori]TPH54313.1 hypothetical protein FIM69_00050 [Helicobacter pylori]
MWSEKVLKVIPATVFLFCFLEIFELAFTVSYINKIEKIETEVIKNLKASEGIAVLLNEHLRGMDSKHFKDKKNEAK